MPGCFSYVVPIVRDIDVVGNNRAIGIHEPEVAVVVLPGAGSVGKAEMQAGERPESPGLPLELVQHRDEQF